MPVVAGPHDQPQAHRRRGVGRERAGARSGRDRQLDRPLGELIAVDGAVRGGEADRAERVRRLARPAALVVGEQVEAGGEQLGEHRGAVAAAVKHHGAPASGAVRSGAAGVDQGA